MTTASKTATAECRHCGKPIRQGRHGFWGARRRDDPHPWYCDASPGDDKRHKPRTGTDVLRAALTAMGVTADSRAVLDEEAEQLARQERWN